MGAEDEEEEDHETDDDGGNDENDGNVMLKEVDDPSNVNYVRSLSQSSLVSVYSDDEQTRTQQFYYDQLRLTPVPKQKTVDKNRLLGILQNLPMNSDENNGSMMNDTDDGAVSHRTSRGNAHIHQRGISSQMSFPDIDKINTAISVVNGGMVHQHDTDHDIQSLEEHDESLHDVQSSEDEEERIKINDNDEEEQNENE